MELFGYFGRRDYVIFTPNQTHWCIHRWQVFRHIMSDGTFRNGENAKNFLPAIDRFKALVNKLIRGMLGVVKSHSNFVPDECLVFSTWEAVAKSILI